MSTFRKTFGILRLIPGVLFLFAPSAASRLFLIPFGPEAAIAGRLFGVREVVIGTLLLRAKDQEESRRLYTQAIAIDCLDLVATAVCFIEGRLDLIPALTTVGGGIVVFIALGLIGLSQKKETEL